MDTSPDILKRFDIDATDAVVRAHLQTAFVDHPTRGPYVTSRKLYEDVEGEIDERFSVELFGMFCESRPYLELWSRGYSGAYRYRILETELE
ncbi:hypothetical protein SAMN04487967_2484 [Natronorubrum sediminis]|uniref:Uncharacterized protein n=1 Tax=Natronorubrum sediminis TaxID=640943 RepID=A0A1H6FZD0_9EURY|nr:hypothetical protein [Natronorubrum sediminis]SEH16191.1 hypothetical protein SAMN04487967_2484 [Natronorubrum sediminis]